MSNNQGFLLIEIVDEKWKGYRIEDPIPAQSRCLDISLSETGFGTLEVEEPFTCGMTIQAYEGEAYFNVGRDGMMVAEAVVVWDASRWPEVKGRIRRCFSHDPFRPTSFQEMMQYITGEIAVLPSADWSRTLQLRKGMTLPGRCPAKAFAVMMIKQVARRRISSEQVELLRKLVAEVAQKLLPQAQLPTNPPSLR